MFSKVLIANRGEIAVRIAHTLQDMGIVAAAVYAEPDREAEHVRVADEAYALGGETAAESYLQVPAILELARRHGADAIHPGYGFLSENAAFAAACADSGVTFIGPRPEVIEAMGDKIVAKRRAETAGVPVVPGFVGSDDCPADELAAHAAAIGYPLLVKAAAGGGGKGMRIVQRPAALDAAVAAARREAGAAFGDGRVFLEKYIARPRHVEVQVFGDDHGQVLHLFERECSIQRRYQKIIEESPSPAVGEGLRGEITAAAVRLAEAIGYTNAGTVEFIVDADGSFYFLEVNTRLQVEHPVTEMVTGLDLVRLQLQVAAGQPLRLAQDDVVQRGHAIEARVYAEDAEHGFVPATGLITRYVPPSGPGIRVDSGVATASAVGVHYDPMLAKLVVTAPDRPAACARLSRALRRFVVLGVTTNIGFLHDVVTHPAFQAGELHTHFLDEHAVGGRDAADGAALALAVAGLAAAPVASAGDGVHRSPWQALGPWRAWPP